MRSSYEVADILNKAWHRTEHSNLNSWQIRTLRAIKDCRTVALGGHIDGCDSCGHIQISYNSCRNRHCPKCQGNKRQQWIDARESELLPVPYFHVVFTLPQELNVLALHKPKEVYDALFAAAWATLKLFSGQNKSGMISILHTWGQNLSLHPHLHCIVPSGSIDKNGKWLMAKSKGKFLFPVKAMSQVFRAKYLAFLRQSVSIDKELSESLFKNSWVVYAKRAFGSPQSVLEYLGRYTHKIAISNHRLITVNKQTVSFSYKDYKTGGEKKVMTLSHEEFIRRFAMHILPKRFMRIRHYGILSSTWKRNKLRVLQAGLLGKPIELIAKETKKQSIMTCPICKTGKMHIIMMFGIRGPPSIFEKAGDKNKHSAGA